MSPALPRRPALRHAPEPFVVELDRFRGPLDLLLHLIRSQDIDIFDIPIARITRQFQEALEAGLERLELDRAGEFLELASTLVRIKAQLLLPRPGEAEWDEDPRAELVRRLLEYELFQEVAHVLSASEADRRRHFGKGHVEPRPVPVPDRQELVLDLDEFLAAAARVPEPRPTPRHRAPVRLVTVEEKVDLLRGRLASRARLAFRSLFSSWRERPHVVASLLACLEMAKQQVVRLEQTRPFGSIWVFRGGRFDDERGEPPREGATEPREDATAPGEDGTALREDATAAREPGSARLAALAASGAGPNGAAPNGAAPNAGGRAEADR